MKTSSKKALVAASVGLALTGCNSSNDDVVVTDPAVSINLRLMETTDLHGAMMPHDYFTDTAGQNYGFARTALVIEEARKEVENSMLFDNGDLIQGTPMADYIAHLYDGDKAYFEDNVHPVFKAMNLMRYDAANIGNHEFNYGLDFLDGAIAGAEFPYVVSNVFKYEDVKVPYDVSNNSCDMYIEDKDDLEYFEPYFNPYVVLDRDFRASDGETYTLKVGVIGFTPPRVMSWDKSHLECQAIVSDIQDAARYYIPKMQDDGADIIVAVPHSGLGGDDSGHMIEDATWQLAYVDGIDAIMFGHDHRNFPTDSDVYDGYTDVDAQRGTINGKPAVMPGFWGNHLGVIDLVVEMQDEEGKEWSVNYTASTAELRGLKANADLIDRGVAAAVQDEHYGTKSYMAQDVLALDSRNDGEINSFFSNLQPDLSVQIVNEAQYHWGQNVIADGEFIPEEDHILLSVSAPFKGGRGGNGDYTNVNGEELTNASVADIYVFDNNTPAILEITAGEVREWLEAVASQQYLTVAKDGDKVLNETFRTYNFDVFYGGWDTDANGTRVNNTLTYTIDVSKEARYEIDNQAHLVVDDEGNPIIIDQDNRRVSAIEYNGIALKDDQVLYVVTNNFRAGGHYLPGINDESTAYEDGANTNRELVAEYLNWLAYEYNVSASNPHYFENAHNFELIAEDAPQGLTVEFLSGPAGINYSEQVDEIKDTGKTDSIDDNDGYRVFKYTFN
ncbi:bifunctional 2',3'-cyclic-nucleotide 2'-phosphodiesterase/3'-nucleotidase [Vibrio sp. FNV 38]|nr:bifunctional 2',3'-cyclic-nucleotide 2'-phosphodiesterase/3'-nucleotidase [Vibrio sp. FNV 38]